MSNTKQNENRGQLIKLLKKNEQKKKQQSFLDIKARMIDKKQYELNKKRMWNLSPQDFAHFQQIDPHKKAELFSLTKDQVIPMVEDLQQEIAKDQNDQNYQEINSQQDQVETQQNLSQQYQTQQMQPEQEQLNQEQPQQEDEPQQPEDEPQQPQEEPQQPQEEPQQPQEEPQKPQEEPQKPQEETQQPKEQPKQDNKEENKGKYIISDLQFSETQVVERISDYATNQLKEAQNNNEYRENNMVFNDQPTIQQTLIDTVPTPVDTVSKDNSWHILKNLNMDKKYKPIIYANDPDLKGMPEGEDFSTVTIQHAVPANVIVLKAQKHKSIEDIVAMENPFKGSNSESHMVQKIKRYVNYQMQDNLDQHRNPIQDAIQEDIQRMTS